MLVANALCWFCHGAAQIKPMALSIEERSNISVVILRDNLFIIDVITEYL
jgi:hypothetical protein